MRARDFPLLKTLMIALKWQSAAQRPHPVQRASFTTATCSARFMVSTLTCDNVFRARQSAGEQLQIAPIKGVIIVQMV